jgi:GalNAc-alpha-(1->4)-GalNAc-alpha-(1->3)-diNAcBac-PP-undecaprenol alpha-1,4-N-acetyl-D-galactosaminyltransferase
MPQKNTILFVIGSLKMGGAQRSAFLLCREFKKRDISVHIYVTFSGISDDFFGFQNEFQVHFPYNVLNKTGKPASIFHRLIDIRRLANIVKPYAVISFMTDANIFTLLATVGLNITKVISERTYPPKEKINPIYSILRKIIYEYSDYLVMQTKKGRNWASLNFNKTKCITIPNCIEIPGEYTHSKCHKLNKIADNCIVYLFVGRITKGKGFFEFIDKCDKEFIKSTNILVVFVGDGDLLEEFKIHIQNNGLENNVLLPGRIVNLKPWYERADVYLLTSDHEGFPNTLLEAMVFGSLVVSFDCDTGPRDLINNGFNGYLIQDQNWQKLNEKLKNIDFNNSFEIREKAKSIYEKHSVQTISNLWLKLLNDPKKN